MLRKLARLETSAAALPKFLTLTYPARFPTAPEAKTHLFTFLKRVKRAFPRSAAFWKMEFQRRGAPHFHLMLYGVPYWNKRRVQTVWGECIGQPEARPFTRIESVKSWRHLMGYAAKYLAKSEYQGDLIAQDQARRLGAGAGAALTGNDAPSVPPVAVAGFNNSTYLTGDGRVWARGPGRYWGVMCAELLPWGELMEAARAIGPWFYQFRRATRRVAPWAGALWSAGWQVMVGDAYRWWEWYGQCAAGKAAGPAQAAAA